MSVYMPPEPPDNDEPHVARVLPLRKFDLIGIPAEVNGARLTPRERQILALVADGLDTAEVAKRLFLAPSTVKNLIARALAKTHARNRTHLVALAFRQERPNDPLSAEAVAV